MSFCPVYPITRLVRSVWISDCCTSKVDLEPIRFLRYVIETLSEVDFIGFDYIHVELFCQRLRPVEVAPWTRSTRRVVQLVQVAYLHKPASCMICLIIDQLPIALPCQFEKYCSSRAVTATSTNLACATGPTCQLLSKSQNKIQKNTSIP